MQTRKTKKYPKILCYLNHFFGKGEHFIGKSSLPKRSTDKDISNRATKRLEHINKVLNEFKSYPNIDIKICGIEGNSLLPLDKKLNEALSNPVNLVFESLSDMTKYLSEYDYFINIEDDVLLPKSTFDMILEFDKVSLINEILLPNRLEQTVNGTTYCVDLKAISGWTWQFKNYLNLDLRVAINPHSGLLIMSREKLNYALSHIKTDFREHILATGMESAFAYYHSPFSLYRSYQSELIPAYHLDKWLYSPGEKGHSAQRTVFYKLKQILKKIIPRKLLSIINFLPLKY